jgi:histidyl-tRNA synthetase
VTPRRCWERWDLDTLEIAKIRGANDVLPPLRAAQLALEVHLRDLFGRYGYQPIETPVLEPTDLFLRKAGEQIAARMYSFTHWNRSLCLRPEHTASVIRAYVNHLQDRPLPVRLQYAGPTFRYEKPQRGRHRQFTEVGVECIGAAGPPADAEVLALARHGLDLLGLENTRFIVGHLGAVLELLGQLGMEPRAQSLVLGMMEHLSRAPGEADRVVGRLAAMLGASDEDDDEDSLSELFRAFGPEGAARIAGDLLERASLQLDGGSRPPDEIVERLLQKSRRSDPTPALQRAVDFIGRLRDVAGPPEDALPAVRQLLADYDLNPAPVLEVEQALQGFAGYFVQLCAVKVDLSLARGLRYYTGLVFEVYDEEDVQIAGGGRYDDLVRALGGRAATPAVGFSYGLERVQAAMQRRRPSGDGSPGAQLLLVPIEQADADAAARLATGLRDAGIAVEVDVRQRGLSANLKHADRTGIPLVAFIGERERAEEVIGLRDMGAHDETRIRATDFLDAVTSRLLPRGAHGGG